MKKLLYILFLLPFISFGQVSNGTELEAESFKATSPQTTTSTTHVVPIGSDGTMGKIDATLLPLTTATINAINTSATPDATTTVKGKVKLAGDLGGTADLPTTPTSVHKTGNETIIDAKIFDGTLLAPVTDRSLPIGLSRYSGIFHMNSSNRNMEFYDGADWDILNAEKIYEIKKTGTDYIVRVPLNDNEDVLISMNTNTLDANGVLNVSYAKVVDKTEPITTGLGYQLNGAAPDDATPVKVNGMYLGANHGNTGLRIVTAASHGKDLSDIGSRWSDGAHFFTLLKVIDSNTLWLISDNAGGSDNYSFFAIVGSTLTYSSNGSHTSSITLSANIQGQLYPSVNINHQTIRDNQGYVVFDGLYRSSDLKMVEEYDIIDTPDMVSKLTSNRPVGGYLTQPSLLNGVALITLKNTYSFTKGGMIIYSDLITRKQCHLEWYGGVQSGYVLPAWATTYKRYIPNTTTVNDGARNWNFRIPESILTSYGSDFNFTSGIWENGVAPNRIVDLITDGANKKINFNMGYVPIGISENRSNVVNNSVFLYAASRKSYPNLITGDKVNDVSSTVISPNKVFSGIMYRIWKAPELVNTSSGIVQIATNDVTYDVGGNLFVNLDFHQTGNFSYPIPEKYNGRKIKVLSKSANLTLLSDVAQNSVSLSISTLDNGYSYISFELIDDVNSLQDVTNKNNSTTKDIISSSSFIGGWSAVPSYARIGHKDFNLDDNYGFLQNPSGIVQIEGVDAYLRSSTGSLFFKTNNITRLGINNSGTINIPLFSGTGTRTLGASSTGDVVVLSAQPLKYTALISQTGTSAPTAVVTNNTLGGTVVWTRTSTGIYAATLSGAFPIGKSTMQSSSSYNGSGTYGSTIPITTSANFFNLYTVVSSSGVLTDGLLLSTPVSIDVYP